MKIHRFIHNFDTSKKNIKITDKDFVNQIDNVLRLKKGEQILLSDGNLNEALSIIKNITKSFVEIEVQAVSKNENEPKIQSTLYCSILKRENFEIVVQKATEVGIKEIVPIITSRTVKLNLNQERLEKIIKEAAEQSGRGVVPKLHGSVDFKEVVKNAKNNNLFFDISGTRLQTTNYSLQAVGLWIGPEGGWDKVELNLAKKSGFEIVSLGKLTLRAETAAIIASYLSLNI